jgi:cell division protein FtsL
MERQPDVTRRKPPGFRPLHIFQFGLGKMLLLAALIAASAFAISEHQRRRTLAAELAEVRNRQADLDNRNGILEEYVKRLSRRR